MAGFLKAAAEQLRATLADMGNRLIWNTCDFSVDGNRIVLRTLVALALQAKDRGTKVAVFGVRGRHCRVPAVDDMTKSGILYVLKHQACHSTLPTLDY